MNRIKILLYDLKSTNKEFIEIINNIDKYTPISLFKSIFSISIYTNTDMYNFLSIYELTNIQNKEITKLIANLKFFQGEKDTDQVILKYFQVLIGNGDTLVLSQENDFLIFERFIILLNSPLFSYAIANQIFIYLQIFLKKIPSLLDKAIYNLKDPSYKYKLLIDSTEVKFVFLVPNLKLLLLDNTKSKYLLQEFYHEIPRWYIKDLCGDILSYLYHNFDRMEVYRDVCYKYFSSLNINEMILELKNLKNNNNDNTDNDNNNNNNDNTDNHNVSLIESFNDTKDITDLLKKYKETTFLLLRFHHHTNLKSLGEFLCNHKNIEHLKLFTATFDFSGVGILLSLRQYLGSFFLVGESQIIHRVLEIFSEQYCINNDYDPAFILNLSFSLLLLNTKMYNPNIKSKPTFDEYIGDFDKEEIPENISMIDMYNSIKKEKIKLPEKNETSMTHYDVYCKMIKNLNINDLLEEPTSQILNLSTYLVEKTISNLLDSPHEKFLEICKYSSLDYILLYLKYNKKDPYRFLNMFKHSLGLKLDTEIFKIFLNFKNKSKFKGLFAEIVNKEVSKVNIRLLEEFYTDDTVLLMLERNINLVEDISYMDYNTQYYILSKECRLDLIKKSQYSIKLLRNILFGNPRKISQELITVFKEVDDNTEDAFYTMVLIQKEEDMFDYVVKVGIDGEEISDRLDEMTISLERNKEQIQVCDQANIKDNEIKLETKNNLNDSNLNDFNLNNSNRNDSNRNDFNRNDSDLKGFSLLKVYPYTISERYLINDYTKLFHFYSTSKSILNQSVLKRLISSGKCIRENELLAPSNLNKRLIYLILKSNTKEEVNYTLWIINLITTCLPVFIDFFTDNITLLKRELSIMKIFVSRLKKVASGLPICCECGYNKIGKIDLFINKVVDEELISMEDIEFWYEFKKKNKIVEEDGDYVLIK